MANTKKNDNSTDETQVDNLPVGDESAQSAATTEVGSEDQGYPDRIRSSNSLRSDLNNVSRSLNGLRWDFHTALVAINPGPAHSEAVAQAQAALDTGGEELPADIRALLEDAIAVHKPLAALYDRSRALLEKYL